MKTTAEAATYLTISESGRYAATSFSVSGPMEVARELYAEWLKRTEPPTAKEPNAFPSGT